MKPTIYATCLAVLILTGLAASASATSVSTTTGGEAETPTIHLVSLGHLSFANNILTFECNSTAEGKVDSHGFGITASTNVTNWTFTTCTGSWHVTTVNPGQLIVHWTNGHNGTVTSNGAQIQMTHSGVVCNLETRNTMFGTLTGGGAATLDVEASLPIAAGSSSELCGPSGFKLRGVYKATAPLYVQKSNPTTTVATTTGGEAATPTVHAVSEGSHVKLANPIANIECGSTVEGTIESHGSLLAKGIVSKLEWPGCTNSWHVTTEKAGELWLEASGGHNGVVTSNGALVKTTRFFVPCNYETLSTKIGTLTGGNPATLKIEASIPIAVGSSELCGVGNAKWEGNYVTTSALYVKG